MKRFSWSRDWRDFFGDRPYPFDLDEVEKRDGALRPMRLVSAVLGAGGPRRVLDLGCGHGRHLAVLAAAGHRAYGTDRSGRAVARAAARHPRGTAVVADNGRLPFRDAVFDAAVSLYTSVGYPGAGPRTVFAEAGRVVRPGGHLVVEVADGRRSPVGAGCERLPGGVGVWFRYGTRHEVRQRNLALSTRAAGLYGFAYRRYTPSSLVDDVQYGDAWTVSALYGGFDGQPVAKDTTAIVVVACRR
ncbi:class I SAM-dependent methyltransferase [Streptomyces sp. NPDC003717]|uniref:class I SAM-dependent methyltransferase n=1 Tax=Streptomyces sp. NPDC003717 TaxID=3154276 RepID=UPI0033AD8331